MNGRIYDPLVGRFFSPDPYIQDGENLQSYNQYSYVYNNPLKYTDPSGYLSASYSNYEDYFESINLAKANGSGELDYKKMLRVEEEIFAAKWKISLPPIDVKERRIVNEDVFIKRIQDGLDGYGSKIYSGKVTFEMARTWYQFAGGTRMDVNLNSIDFSRVRNSDFNSRGLATIRLDTKHFSNVNDALVHGTITLQRINNTNKAKIALNSGLDFSQLKGKPAGMFNFEMQPVSDPVNFIRNPATVLGGIIYGTNTFGGTFYHIGGTPFPIYYHGDIIIKQ